MPEDATALLALWNDVDPALELLYNDWHAREHVPQRLTVPGILWGWRYRRAGVGAMPRYLTLYGLREPAVLDSEAYQHLLREPTPLSQQMRPALRNLSRWVCSLDRFCGLDPYADVCVHTWAAQAAAPPTPVPGTPSGLPAAPFLLAHRLPQVRALPWLSGSQQSSTPSVDGDWLQITGLTAARSTKHAGPDGAIPYTSLTPR